jgi:hypothetical protein
MHFSSLRRHAISNADAEAEITAWLECLSHEKMISSESVRVVSKQLNVPSSVLHHGTTACYAAKHSA